MSPEKGPFQTEARSSFKPWFLWSPISCLPLIWMIVTILHTGHWKKQQKNRWWVFHYFYVHRPASLGKWSNLTLTNQMPWNHQAEKHPSEKSEAYFQRHPDLVEILASRGTSLLPTLFNGILVVFFLSIFSDLSASHKCLRMIKLGRSKSSLCSESSLKK